MESNVSIRPLGPDDYSLWKEFFRDYGKVWNEPMPEERLARVWALFSDPENKTRGLGITCDGVLAGFAHYMLYPDTYSARLTCYFNDLYVAPTFRNRGIARAVFAHVFAVGKKEGWFEVHWKTRTSNETAIKLYDSLAVRETGWIRYKKPLL